MNTHFMTMGRHYCVCVCMCGVSVCDEHASDKRWRLSSWTRSLNCCHRYTRTLPSSINSRWLTTFRWLTLFLNESEGGGVIRRLSGLVLEGKTDKPREMGISQRCWLPLISTDKASLWCSVKCKIKMSQKPRGAWHPFCKWRREDFPLFSLAPPTCTSLSNQAGVNYMGVCPVVLI